MEQRAFRKPRKTEAVRERSARVDRIAPSCAWLLCSRVTGVGRTDRSSLPRPKQSPSTSPVWVSPGSGRPSSMASETRCRRSPALSTVSMQNVPHLNLRWALGDMMSYASSKNYLPGYGARLVRASTLSDLDAVDCAWRHGRHVGCGVSFEGFDSLDLAADSTPMVQTGEQTAAATVAQAGPRHTRPPGSSSRTPPLLGLTILERCRRREATILFFPELAWCSDPEGRRPDEGVTLVLRSPGQQGHAS